MRTAIKAIVTGSSGFFGRSVVEMLRGDPYFEVHNPTRADMNVTDADAIEKFLREIGPNVLINCAGITGNYNCTKAPDLAYAVNVKAVENLAAQCRRQNILLVHPSSVVVFDGLAGNYKENDAPKPAKGNIYAETKAESEKAVMNSGVDFIIPRIATGYGPIDESDTTNLLGIVIKGLKQGERRKYFGDQFANPVETHDIAQAFGRLIKTGYQGFVHIGGPDIVSIYDFANMVQREFGLNGEIEKASLTDTNYPPNITLNISLAKKLGLKFKGVEEGIRYCKSRSR